MPGRFSPKPLDSNITKSSMATRENEEIKNLDDPPAILGDNPQSADAEFPLVGGTAVAQVVFEASDLYSVLRAPRLATPDELLHCYLKTAVEVHPKNITRDDTTDVFLRTTSAWVELRDPQSRWRYDMELSAGRGLLKSESIADEVPQHILVPLSIERAMAEFATAAMSCSGGVSDEMLLKARTFAGHEKRENLTSDMSPTISTVACGLALSAGMMVAGTAVSAAGYPGVGACVRKGAMYQGASQAAMGGVAIYQTPGVRERLQSRVQWAGSLLDNMPSCLAVRQKAIGVSSISEPKQEAKKEPLKKLPRGCRVRLCGLQGACHLNGRLGDVVGFDGKRYQVRIAPIVCKVGVPASKSGSCLPKKDGSDIKLIKRENLDVVSEFSQPQQFAVSQQEFM